MNDFTKHILKNPVCVAAKKTAARSGIRAYIVGGYVRDLLLGKKSQDVDFVVEGDGIAFAQDVLQQIASGHQITVFKTFGTAHFVIDNIEYEFVGARRESYSKNSRNPSVEGADIEEDQQRRDFTINAMRIGLNNDDTGQLYDPFQGQKDLRDGIIRTPLEPKRTFDDDPLRMLRAIRFASQLGFTIDPICLQSIQNLAERITIITPERVSEELNKMLIAPIPSVAFDLLSETGILQYVLPEVDALRGVDKVDRFSHKDVYTHTMQVLDSLSQHSDNVWLRWAALLHDVGKPSTKRFAKGHGWTFHGHEVIGQRITTALFKRLKLPLNDKLLYINKIIGLHLRPIALVEDEVTDSAVRRLLFEAGNDIEDLMILCRADITSKNQKKVERYLENFNFVEQKLAEVEAKDKVRNWQPPVSGEIIMETFGLPPSKEVGLIKNAIREAILDGIIENSFEAAQQFMLEYATQLHLFPTKKEKNNS